jgi:hypothetical protein
VEQQQHRKKKYFISKEREREGKKRKDEKEGGKKIRERDSNEIEITYVRIRMIIRHQTVVINS